MIGVSSLRAATGTPSFRLGVMIPGFSCCAATACTLSEDADAGSRFMPSRCTKLCFRGAWEEPRESTLVGDAVSDVLAIVLAREIVRATSSGSPISAGDSLMSAGDSDCSA